MHGDRAQRGAALEERASERRPACPRILISLVCPASLAASLNTYSNAVPPGVLQCSMHGMAWP